MKGKSYLIFLLLFMQVDFYLFAQPVLSSFTTNRGNGTVTAVIARPAGVIAGDLLVAGLMKEKGSGVTVTPPMGWTLILNTNNGTDCGISTYYKIAGTAEPVNYTFNFNTSQSWSIGLSRIINADTTNPIGTFLGQTGTGVAGTVIAPSIAPVSTNALILCYYTNKKDATYIPDATTTEIYDFPGTGLPSNMLATFVHTVAGNTGNRSATPSQTERWAAQQIEIKYDITLPISLLNFSAECYNSSTIRLNWQTASEVNNNFFTIERSIDGQTWVEVNQAQGAGNSTHLKSYSALVDNTETKTIYYRLRQTDYDGTFTHSEIIARKCTYSYGLSLNIYPNPFKEAITIEGVRGVLNDIRVYNTFGENISKKVDYFRRDENTLILNFKSMSAGIYIIRSGETYHQVLVKSNP